MGDWNDWGFSNPFAVTASTDMLGVAAQVVATFIIVVILEAVAIRPPNLHSVAWRRFIIGWLLFVLLQEVFLLWSMGAPAPTPSSVGVVLVEVFASGFITVLISSRRAASRSRDASPASVARRVELRATVMRTGRKARALAGKRRRPGT